MRDAQSLLFFPAVTCLGPSCQFGAGNTECRLAGMAPLSTRWIALLKYRHLSRSSDSSARDHDLQPL